MAIERCLATADAALTTRLQAILSSKGMLSVLKKCAVDDAQQLLDCIGINSSQATVANSSQATVANSAPLKQLLDCLLDPAGSLGKLRPLNLQTAVLNHTGIAAVPYDERVRRIIELADDLSLPFCQLALRHALSSGSHNSDSMKDGPAVALFGAINTALEGEHMIWTELISGLDVNATCQVSPSHLSVF